MRHALLPIAVGVVPTALFLTGCSGGSDRLPTGPGTNTVALEPAWPNLSFARPVFATPAPDGSGRMFVVEQAGRILVFPDDPAVTQAGVFLDISSQVAMRGEMGLLGLAFPPDYASSGHFFVYYTADGPRRSILDRYTVSGGNPDQADPGSRLEILTVLQPFDNHNGGMLAFGPDGMLYVSLGDGGSGNDPMDNGQDPGTLLGTLLRLDVSASAPGSEYAIPPDNPLLSMPGARGEVYAYGLRNPWRFSFDRNTGELWVGDVGQGAREEVHRVQAGDNCGWPVYEGTLSNRNPGNLPPSAFAEPVYDYDRAHGASITGGYIYRGTAIPSLVGAYVYADYMSDSLWALALSGGQAQVDTLLSSVADPSSLGEDSNGELLVVSLVGAVYRLVPR